MRRLLALGLPTAIQYTLETGVFAIAASLAGRLGAAALAAHEIALNVCGFTFMVPLGISSAGAVRVGQAIGKRDPRGAIVSGWTALAVGAAFMLCAALAFVLIPERIIGLYTTDSRVLSSGIALLVLAAAFQLFDGLQVVASGNLRGAGDTRTPMYANLLAHWCVGLPIGYVLGFLRGWGVFGLWVGLSTGLIVAGGLLVRMWSSRAGTLGAGEPTEPRIASQSATSTCTDAFAEEATALITLVPSAGRDVNGSRPADGTYFL
jgi:MATE family multidrug resistance protein